MTKTNTAVLLAFNKGYRVDTQGRVISPSGKIRKCATRRRGNDARYTFTISLKDHTVFPVPIHKLVAYQKYKEKSFKPKLVVRHIDGDAFNNHPDNILLGTISDNMLDRPTEDRKLHAQKAGKAASPYNEKIWDKIRKDYHSGVGYKRLRNKYGVSLSALSYQLSKSAKRQVMITP